MAEQIHFIAFLCAWHCVQEKDSSRKRQRTSTAGSSNPEQSELQDELQRVTEELKQTKTSLSTDSAKLVETGVLLTTSKAKVKELQSLVETYKSTASGTTRRIKELEDSVKSHESRMKDMAAALYLAQTGHRNAAAERQRFKIISKELDARVNGLNRRIKDTDAELQKAAEDRQANISYYKLAIDKCNKTIAGLQGKISDLESKGKEGEGQLGEATAEAVKWKEKVEELSGKVDSLSAECMQLRNENKEVVERYGQREKALATRHNQRMKDTVPQEVDGGDIMAIVGDLVPADDSLQKSPLSQDAQKELIASLVTSSDASAVDAVRKLYTSGVVQLPDIVEAPDGKIGTMKMVSPGKHIVVQTNSLDTVTQAAECLMRNPQRFGDRINRESWRAILGDEDEANRDMAPYIREICPAAAAVFSGELLLGKDIPYPEGENAVCRLDYAGLLNPDFISVMCANHDDEISAFFGTMGELSISAAYYS